MLPAEEAEELACLALAAMDSEPVGYFGRFDPDDEDLIDQCSKNVKGAFPLYRHAQQPVVPDAAAVYAQLSDHEKWSTSLENVNHVLNAFRAAMLAAAP